MKLTPTQIKCLRAIREGRGTVCLRGYRFQSAAVLERRNLISGDRNKPYWMWRLTTDGLWALNMAGEIQCR